MRSSTPRLLLATVLLALGCGAAGCTKSGDPVDREDSAGTAGRADAATTKEAKAQALPKGVKGATNVPTDVPNEPDLRDKVTLETCRATRDGWTARGDATNPDTEPRTYTVTVFFTTKAATVIGTGSTEVDTGPEATESWQVSDTFKAPKDTRCVLRGVG